MKFGKKIIKASELSPTQWQQEWLNYKQLKKMIKDIEDEIGVEKDSAAPEQRANRSTSAEEMGE
jgi:SPX domain protein involved in polyphosphate accumulation